MGLLTEGEPLSWDETKKLRDHVKRHGVRQFISLYKKLEHRKGDVLKWGDEIEYTLVKLHDDKGEAKVLLDAHNLLKQLQEPEKRGDKDLNSLWRPEFAEYMVEGTPGVPYCGSVYGQVEESMKTRRMEVQALLGEGEKIFSMSAFPRLGCSNFTHPPYEPKPETSHTRSLFWPSEATFPGHPRFRTLSTNIRQRRGRKVAINVPVFKDENTIDPFVAEKEVLTGDKQEPQSRNSPKPWHIYLDAMGFGMGLSCLQMTWQGFGVFESEMLYDQLVPLCPIMLAMTASTPFARGYLADVDCRWDIISASVDCRTKEELGEEPLKHDRFVIPKSRYSSVSSYLSICTESFDYNDVPLVYDAEVYQTLKEHGVKETMAKHVAHLFIRDTISLFSEKIHQRDEDETDHFENIQSTNWQSMRFKPPPPNSEIGWRVEFRPCDLQLTDFENAAVCCFVVILTRVILSYRYNLLIPVSKVDENMRRAQKRDAVLNQKFFFRTNINAAVDGSKTMQSANGEECFLSAAPEIEELTIDEIFNGCQEKKFPGLLAIVREYMVNLQLDADTCCTLSCYWSYLGEKASGKLRTHARFMRDFIIDHPEYRKDSVITEKIQYDLLKMIDELQQDEKEFVEALRRRE